MSSDFTYSWHAVERGCFEYLNKALGTLENVQAFTLDDMPRTMPDDGADFYIWHFMINGGAKNIQRQNRALIPSGAWEMNAEFSASCSTDYVAKLVGGIIENAMPATSADVDGLALLYNTEFPSRERVTRNVLNEDRAGDERIFFEMRIPMIAAFGNVDKME